MTNSNEAPASSGASPLDDERISGAELRVWLDWLGLTQWAAAELLHVREDTVRRWLSGKESVPIRVGEEMEQVDEYTARAVGSLVDALNDMRDPAVLIYREDRKRRVSADEVMWEARPSVRPYPASWWRMVVARAAAEVPGVVIHYAPKA